MKHTASSQQRPLFRVPTTRLSNGLKNLGFLLFGVGIGTVGTSWLAAKSDSPYPLKAEQSPTQSSQSPAPSSASPTVSPSPASPPAVNQTDVANATVCVKTKAGWGEDACASGVSIDPQLAGIDPTQGAVVLTNYHVIMDMGERPPLQLGGKGEVFNAEIIRRSPEFDLALLLVPKAEFPVAALAESSPNQGTEVRAIGFPNNQPLTIKDSSLLGQTQNCLAVAPCLALQQGTITFGNSGGPLEAGGRVIGITQGEIEDEVAIPVEQIRQFLSGELPPANSSSQFGSGQFESEFPPMRPPGPPMRQPRRFPPGGPPPYPMW